MPQTIRPIVPAVLAAPFVVLAATLMPPGPAPAATPCLAAPNADAPQGRHWYYRYDRVKQRKCWYLGAAGQKVRQAATPADTRAPSRAAPVEETDAAPTKSGAGAAEPHPRAVRPAAIDEPAAMPAAPGLPSVLAWPDPPSAPASFGERIEALGSFMPRVDAVPAVAEPVAAVRPAPPPTPEREPQPAVAASAGTSYELARTLLMIVLAFGLAGLVARAGFVIAAGRRRRIRIDRSALWREFEAAEWAPPLAPSAPANSQAGDPAHEPEVARGAAAARAESRVPEDPSQLRFLRRSRAA